jgi:hypothetical protein
MLRIDARREHPQEKLVRRSQEEENTVLGSSRDEPVRAHVRAAPDGQRNDRFFRCHPRVAGHAGPATQGTGCSKRATNQVAARKNEALDHRRRG